MEKKKLVISILAGILCFLLSPYGVVSEWGEIVIDIPWVIVFPVIISMAFGWRYALVVSISGGAIYPFYVWFENGYVCVLVSITYTLTYVLLGILNEPSFIKLIRSYSIRLAAIFVSILLIFYISYIHLFEVFLSFNPSFWNGNSITSMDEKIVQGILLKNSINYLVTLLLSTSLIKLPAIQKLLMLNTSPVSKDNAMIFFSSILIGCLVWFVFYMLTNSLIQVEGDNHKHYLTLAFYVIFFSNLLISRVIMEYSERSRQNLITISENENLLRTVINTIPDLIWLKDINGTYLKCNKRFELFVGQQEPEIIGKTDYDFVSNVKAIFFRENDLKTLNAREPVINEEVIEYKNKQHKETWETIKAPLIINEDTIGILGIGRNVTERKKSEEELEMHRNHLEKLVKSRTEELESAMVHLQETQAQLIQSEKMASLGVLTAGVAHEINNPLNFILGSYLGLSEMLKEDSGDDEVLSQLLDNLKIGVDKAAGIVKGLNQFSRDQDSFDEDCDVHIILDNCLIMLNSQLKEHIEIKKDYAEGQLQCKGNVAKLHQVFINIITNAKQGIETNGEIKISTRRIGNSISIEIADTGCGISKENLPKVLDPFYTTKAPGEGTGLGLSITYNIVTQHSGQLDLSSKPNEGTTVKILLPIEIDAMF
ncbi:MAG: PAS domain S-box protein [Cyclobacteriaceae bacterium]